MLRFGHMAFLILWTLGSVNSWGLAKERVASPEEVERDEDLQVLNESPWSRQLTITRVVSGVG
ncbi:MAG: hypothetical protein JSU96_10415, partial [Acidobacteriota bacterium]